MEDLTFGEQVKIVLGRKGMTIKELAETIEKETGKKMSRQNLTQRLGRDNFQEQDMRLIASILGCPFQLSIMSGEIAESAVGRIRKQEVKWNEQEQPEESFSEETVETEKEEQQLTGEERDMTIGEIYDMHEELAELEKNAVEAEPTEGVREDLQTEEEYKEEPQEVPESDQEEENSAESEVSYTEDYAQPTEEEAEPYEEAEVTSYETQPVEPVQEEVGDINPYTGREYESNSVRMHPKRIGYVQVYDRANHKWTDMTEWAFLGYQERKKVLLGEDYEPPIYLD
jgi:vacuolar-type H+-ATPase subunit I/STV1